MIPTLCAGTFFRRNDRVVRFIHSFNTDGTPAATIQEQPRELFERIFGTAPELAEDDRSRRLRRSVLDSILEQYPFLRRPQLSLGGGFQGTFGRPPRSHPRVRAACL
jgi:hypothetical protein